MPAAGRSRMIRPRRITTTRCDNSGMTYDGTQYRYAVRAVNTGVTLAATG